MIASCLLFDLPPIVRGGPDKNKNATRNKKTCFFPLWIALRLYSTLPDAPRQGSDVKSVKSMNILRTALDLTHSSCIVYPPKKLLSRSFSRTLLILPLSAPDGDRRSFSGIDFTYIKQTIYIGPRCAQDSVQGIARKNGSDCQQNPQTASCSQKILQHYVKMFILLNF